MLKLNREEIIKNVFNKSVLLSTLFLFFTSQINPYIGKFVIPLFAPNRPSAPDLFFAFFPYVRSVEHLNFLFVIPISIVFIISLFKENCKDLNRYILSAAIIYGLRAIVILFTPLGVPAGIDLTSINTSSIFWDSGYFFSGHTVFYVITYLFIDPKYKVLKTIGLISCIGGLLVVLLARNHYTIDVYGGIVTSLLVYEYMKRKK